MANPGPRKTKELTKGPFLIVEDSGRYGLKKNDNLILPCIFVEINWAEDYVCLFDGEKWAVVDCERLYTLPCLD